MTGKPPIRKRGQSSRGQSSRGRGIHVRGKNSTSNEATTSSGIKIIPNAPDYSDSTEPNLTKSYKDLVVTDPKYVDLLNREEILSLEPDDLQWLNDPEYLFRKHLSLTGFPMTDSKPRMYYVSILQFTESCDIKSFYHNNNTATGIINYSKCTINKVLSIIDWGMDAYKTRSFKQGEKLYQYNYWDYQNAWKLAFYYDNPKKKHSWFFFFHKEFFMKTKTIPLWLYNWWYIYGPTIKFLPDQLYQKYTIWVECHPKLQTTLLIGQSMFYFMAENFIPWIWRWGIEIGYNVVEIPCLYRTFHVRLWAQWQMQETLEKIDEKISLYAQEHKQVQNPSMDINTLKKYFERKFPHFSETQILHKCMEYMKKQFSETFQTTLPDQTDQMSIESDTSLQFAQAPPSLEEIWNDMEKSIARGKGKIQE